MLAIIMIYFLVTVNSISVVFLSFLSLYAGLYVVYSESVKKDRKMPSKK